MKYIIILCVHILYLVHVYISVKLYLYIYLPLFTPTIPLHPYFCPLFLHPICSISQKPLVRVWNKIDLISDRKEVYYSCRVYYGCIV